MMIDLLDKDAVEDDSDDDLDQLLRKERMKEQKQTDKTETVKSEGEMAPVSKTTQSVSKIVQTIFTPLMSFHQ